MTKEEIEQMEKRAVFTNKLVMLFTGELPFNGKIFNRLVGEVNNLTSADCKHCLIEACHKASTYEPLFID